MVQPAVGVRASPPVGSKRKRVRIRLARNGRHLRRETQEVAVGRPQMKGKVIDSIQGHSSNMITGQIHHPDLAAGMVGVAVTNCFANGMLGLVRRF